MSAIPGRTSGFGTSVSVSTSGPPVSTNTIAFTLDTSEDVRPLLEHLRMPVADADGEVSVAGPAELADALLQLGSGRRERHRADQVGGADLLLLRAQEHEMPAVVGEIARVRRLVLQVDLAVALDQRRQRRRQAAAHVAELLDLDQVVQRDRGVGPRLRARARTVERLAVLQHAPARERRGRAAGWIRTDRAPRRLHVGDGGPGRAQVAGRADPAGAQLGGEP